MKLILLFLTLWFAAVADPYPPSLSNGAKHFNPVAWPANAEWKPYTRFDNGINDPRTNDPSNGGTRPQNYVNIASSCTDKAEPSIYYYLYQGSTPEEDVIMFRWRVEQVANTYATGPKAGAYSAGDVWNSALWTVFFDVDGDGYRDLAAHLDGSSGNPSEPIDRIFGIYGNVPTQSIDYINDPSIKIIAHNPTAFIGSDNSTVLNFHNNLTSDMDWSATIAAPDEQKVWDYGTTRSSYNTDSPCVEYFIDYQIPVGMLDASAYGGPKLTRETPLSMMFCTANSLNNPTQKDCAINKEWMADPLKPGPYGDYISFDRNNSYIQPIVDEVTSSGCNPVKLSAKVKDAIAIVNGEAVPSVKTVEFYYYEDKNGNGVADDGGSWSKAGDALRQDFINWTYDWTTTALPKGQYLVGVKTTDDPTLVDDGMPTTGTTNVTYSYLTQTEVDALGGKPANENWFANPDYTGVKSVALAVNTCGVAPTITKTATPESVASGDEVTFSVTIDNSTGNLLHVSSISDLLPAGFTYKTGSSQINSVGTSDPAGSTGTIVWSVNMDVPDGSNLVLDFIATASSVAGTYNNTASASTTQFGTIESNPAQVQVDAARISLTKTPSTYLLNPGDPVTYTLTYSNDSSVTVTDANITDTLPANVTCNSYSVNGGAVQSCSGNPVTMLLGDLAGFANGSVELNVTVKSAYSSSSLLNQATLGVKAPDGTTVTKDASSTIAVNIPTPAFTLVKTSNIELVAPDGDVTFTITYSNYGTAAATGVTISDELPFGFTFKSCSDSCSGSGSSYSWSIPTVASGATGSVTITATATADVNTGNFTGANPATNTANLLWSGPNPGGPVTAEDQVGVSGGSCQAYYFSNQLANVGADGSSVIPLSGTAQPTAVDSLSGLSTSTYTTPTLTATLQEIGRFFMDPAVSGSSLSSTQYSLDTIITYVKNGTASASITLQADIYEYDPSTGATQLIESGTLSSPGASGKLPQLTLSNAFDINVGNRVLWVFSAKSNKTDNTLDIAFNDPRNRALFCQASTPASLSISKTVDKPNITSLPDALTYTIEYANVGGTTATNVILSDTLPANVTCNSYSINGGATQSCPVTAISLGSLAAGATGYVTINTTATASASGTLTNSATIDSTETDPVSDTAETKVGSLSGGGAPELVIEKSSDKAYLTAGEVVTYTLKVINVGQGDATSITVNDTIPSNGYFSYVASSITGATTRDDASAPDLTWSIATLPAGSATTLTFQMQSATSGIPSGVTTLNNTATLSDAVVCTNTSISGCTSNEVPVTISGNPVLEITLTPDAPTKNPCDVVTYTMDFNNTGASDANNTRITLPIPAHLTLDISSLPAYASFDGINNRIVFDVGTMDAGENNSTTFKMQVDCAMPSGTTTLDANATISASNAASKSDDAVVDVSARVDLIVDITGPSSAENNASICLTYGVIYKNAGNADATNAELNVTLPAGLTYSSATPTPTSAPSPIRWSLGGVAVGAYGSFQIVACPTGGAGTYTVSAKISSDAVTDNPEGNNTDAQETVVGGLVVSKSTTTPLVVQPTADGAKVDVNYSITIANTLSVAVSDVNVTDKLPAGFEYKSTTSVVTSGYSVDTTVSQPVWKGLNIPANGSVIINFVATIDNTVGAATYQNEVKATTTQSGVAVIQYDELSHPDEDVTVLASNKGIVEGYVFEDTNNNDIYEPGIDNPFTYAKLTLISGSTTYIVYTDYQGFFSRVVPAGVVNVDVDDAAITSGLTISSNHSDTTDVTVPAGGVARDDNAYQTLVISSSSSSSVTSAPSSSTASSSSSSAVSSSSSSVMSSSSSSMPSSSSSSSSLSSASSSSLGCSVDSDNDGVFDCDEGTGDSDGDGTPDYADYDPMGYFYDSSNGQIITGGSVLVTCNPVYSINYVKDGSDGQYEWHVASLAGETNCTMTYTLPSGYMLDSACPVTTGLLDPTGQPDPYILGSSQFGSTGYLADGNCSANPWYLQFALASGDPQIFHNNIPLRAVEAITVPLLHPLGALMLALLFGIIGYRRIR